MIERIGDGIWWLQLGWRPPLRRNAYLVDDGNELTLIDVGMPWDDNTIRDHLQTAGYALSAVDQVLVTHYDFDHVGGLRRLNGDLDARVYMGQRDYGIVSREYTPPLFHHKGAFHRALRRLFPLPSSISFHPLADGEQIGGFTAYHTPGHNPGHTVYVHEGLSAAFLGDLVWEKAGSFTTPVLLDSYSMVELRESVRQFASRSPPFELACVGHGTPLKNGGTDALETLAASLG